MPARMAGNHMASEREAVRRFESICSALVGAKAVDMVCTALEQVLEFVGSSPGALRVHFPPLAQRLLADTAVRWLPLMSTEQVAKFDAVFLRLPVGPTLLALSAAVASTKLDVRLPGVCVSASVPSLCCPTLPSLPSVCLLFLCVQPHTTTAADRYRWELLMRLTRAQFATPRCRELCDALVLESGASSAPSTSLKAAATSSSSSSWMSRGSLGMPP